MQVTARGNVKQVDIFSTEIREEFKTQEDWKPQEVLHGEIEMILCGKKLKKIQSRVKQTVCNDVFLNFWEKR